MSASAPPDPSVHRAGERLTLRLGPMVHGGVCLAHTDAGVTLMADGGVPGEVVDLELTYRKRSVWFARVVTAVEPSEHRVEPPCPYVGACGGCQLQHIAYAHQVSLKRAIVLDAMRRQGVVPPGDVGVHPMDDPWRYRWRGEFHVVRGPGDAAPGLGFNRVRSWHPVAVDDCLIHSPTITRSLPALRRLIRGATERLSVLHVTAGNDGRELLLRPKPRDALDPSMIDAASADLPDGTTLSTEATTLHWRGHVFRATPDSFIQVNQAQMDILYGRVLRALGEIGADARRTARVVDAYAGIGVLSVAIADAGAEVVCIEENRASARMGMLNARVNGVDDRVSYVAEAVEDALPRVIAAGAVDAVILDPPRAGCDARVTAWLALAGPGRVVYISCDPATLARDLRILAASGPYEIEALDIVDMFPQTHHVECVASLRRTGD